MVTSPKLFCIRHHCPDSKIICQVPQTSRQVLLKSSNRACFGPVPIYDWSGRAMARSGLRMMPTFPSLPLKFRTASFPRYGFKAGISDQGLPGRRIRAPLSLPPPFVLSAFMSLPRSVSGDATRLSTSVRAASAALPQGPSLRSELFCLGPSTLNRPHPPHSQAHPDFAALRLIPDAFAVHTAPRRPPSGSALSLPFLPDMPPSTTPGRSEPVSSSLAVPT